MFFSFLSNINGKQKLLLGLSFVFIFGTLLALWTKGIIGAIIVAGLSSIILWVSRRIWYADGYGKNKIRRYSLFIILSIAIKFTYQDLTLSSFITKPILNFLKIKVDFLNDINIPAQALTIDILIFVLAGVFIVNYWMRDKTAMGIHKSPLEKEFPEKEYEQRLEAFCRIIGKDLDEINRETSWSEEYFTPLDAEVEVKSKNSRKRKITDLLKAIKKDKASKVFLILGDPGSGKSVALRKLCSELLKEVKLTGRVPIYINLREWETKERWTEENPPTVQQLYNFIIENIKSKGDVFTDDFVDEYFKKMFDHGRIFFLIDSFDEIPSVLDVGQDSWLIDKLSSIIYTFLAGAQDSRGVLSSRLFRKPTHNFDASSVLEIRPFSEEKIRKRFFDTFKAFPELEKLLFKNRQELIPLARNPFTAALIIDFARKNGKTLPLNQAQLYTNYIDERLEKIKNRIKKSNLKIEEIKESMTEIAYYMFKEQEFGLEVPFEKLVEEFPEKRIDETIRILEKIRLGRIGKGEDRLFSFAHRRFNEYFVAQKLIQNSNLVPKDAIPTDSRWRDALVLYCEVASEKEARKIAEFCWSEIKKVKDEKLNLTDKNYRRAIHSLRFLKDAFYSRKDLLDGFRDELSNFIFDQISPYNLLESKLILESTGIASEEKINQIILKAFYTKNSWISETALRSCRHIPKLDKRLEKRIINYIFQMDTFEFLKRRSELSFSFGLSDGFQKIKKKLNEKYLESKLFILGIFLLVIVFPFSLIFILIAFLFFIFFKIEEVEEDESDMNDAAKLLGMRQINRLNLENLWIVKLVLYLSNKFGEPVDKLKAFNNSNWIIKPSLEVNFKIVFVFCLVLILVTNYNSFLYLFLVFNQFSYTYGIIIGVGLLTLIPWYSINFIFKNINYLLFKDFIINLVKFILEVLILCLILIFPFFLPPPYNYIFYFIIPCIFILPIFLNRLIGFIMIRIISRKDKIYLKTIEINKIHSRQEIVSTLEKLNSIKGKINYLNMIEEKKVEVYGEWKNNKIPYPHQEVFFKLSQLEEKWLGFDR